MIDIKYANAYSEVLEILKYISIEDYNKIPENKIEFYKKNANSEYYFEYNPEKTLQEQNVSKLARGIIAILFRDYWASDIQREKIIEKQNFDRRVLEEEKRKKYNIDNIFNKSIGKESIVVENRLVINEEKWYKKLLKFLQMFF